MRPETGRSPGDGPGDGDPLLRYVGVPYVDRGRSFSGVDCWGLVWLYLTREAGLDLPSYSETPAEDLMAVATAFDGEAASGRWIRTITPRRFDIVQMWTHERHNGRAVRGRRHCGVMLDARRVLHTERGTASVIVHLKHPLVRERVMAFWRHSGM